MPWRDRLGPLASLSRSAPSLAIVASGSPSKRLLVARMIDADTAAALSSPGAGDPQQVDTMTNPTVVILDSSCTSSRRRASSSAASGRRRCLPQTGPSTTGASSWAIPQRCRRCSTDCSITRTCSSADRGAGGRSTRRACPRKRRRGRARPWRRVRERPSYSALSTISVCERSCATCCASSQRARRDTSGGVAGSQELETLDIEIDGRQLHVEAETYMGLSIAGPADLVDRVSEMVKQRK
jgi:hypothetical protein